MITENQNTIQYIEEHLSGDWNDIVDWMGKWSIDQIVDELNKMFPDEKDTNPQFASEVYEALN